MNELMPLNRFDLQQCLRRAPRGVLHVLKQYPRKSCIAGGFIRAVIANERINDIDLFAADKAQASEMSEMLAWGVKTREELKAIEVLGHGNRQRKRVIDTDNAFTVTGYPLDPQIVHRWTFDDILDVTPSFDFTIACATIFWCDRLNRWEGFCDPGFYQDLAAKRLVYRSPARNEDAGGSMLRVLKFYSRGYRIPLDSLGAVMARMANAVTEEGLGAMTLDEGTKEKAYAKIFTGLLREVDPLLDPTHICHIESVKPGAVEDPIGNS